MIKNIELFQAMFREATLGIIVVDSKGKILIANALAAELFRYSVEELKNISVQTLVPTPLQSVHQQHLAHYFQNPSPRKMGEGRDLFGKRQDGSLFPIEISLSPIQVESENYVVTYISDISVRKKMINELADSRSKLSAIINTAAEGILTLNKLGSIESVNPALARTFGYKAIDMPHLLLSDIVQNQSKNYKLENLHDSSLWNDNIFNSEDLNVGIKSNGETFPISIKLSQTLLRKGKIFTAVIQDLSIQKAAEQKLNSYANALENKVEERTQELLKNEAKLKSALKKEQELGMLKSRFVSMASHEFRTPLSTILSSANLIEKYPNGDQQIKRLRHIRRIESAVENLTSILNDFLSLEKLETGKVTSNFKKIHTRQILEELVDLYPDMNAEKAHITIDDQIKDYIYTDPHLLKNILVNLLSNSIKYAPQEKPIALRLHLHHSELVLTVQDYGIGIPEEEQKHLFERFFRASNATNIKGTGLGLNIVQRYVKLLEGYIRFESKENVGTTFWVYLPQPR